MKTGDFKKTIWICCHFVRLKSHLRNGSSISRVKKGMDCERSCSQCRLKVVCIVLRDTRLHWSQELRIPRHFTQKAGSQMPQLIVVSSLYRFCARGDGPPTGVRSCRRRPFSREASIVTRLACLFTISLALSAQVSLVHVTSCGPGPFPATTCTIPSTGGGNLIVVAWSSNGGTTPVIAGLADNAQNTYVEAGNARAVDSSNDMVDIWFAKNSAAGATTLTITPNPSGNQGAAVIWEFTNADTSSPWDQTSVLNSQPATTSPTSAPVTTSAAGDVIVSVVVPGGTKIYGIAPGNVFTNDFLFFGNGWAHLAASGAGTYNAQWTTDLGTYASSTVAFRAAATGICPIPNPSPCDLNCDGTVDSADTQLAVNMSLGLTTPCTANVDGLGVCNAIVVQRIVVASLGGGCVTGDPHSVSLSWTASVSPGVAGYNVYRSTVSGGPYIGQNSSPVTGTSYSDSTVQAGQTYYYVATAVDNSGNESPFSNEAQAIIPNP